MKKVLLLVAVAAAMTACTSDVDLGMQQANKENADNAIGFQVLNKNMSRAALEDAKHYNFGVWAYKNTDDTHDIMANYLVGYFGTTNKGYKKSSKQTTWGDAVSTTDLLSLWAYEGLGTDEYDYTGTEGYYTKFQTAYMSNLTNQYLRYFDESSDDTKFYAYAPYINSANPVTFDNRLKVMTFPNGSITEGYDDESLYEYLYGATEVVKTNYRNDVQLNFKHLNSRIRIVFYEDIAGYSVTMKNLDVNAGIIAVPTKQIGDSYSYANNTLAKTASATIDFSNIAAPVLTTPTASSYYVGSAGDPIDASIKDKALVFAAPVATVLSENRATALNSHVPNDYYSANTYYGIPHDSSCGLTFRVSFVLTSTTGEQITVSNAGVFVDAANCVWEAGKNYTYVFKITKNTNGTTAPTTPTVDPNPGAKALYPIVFDGITVDDWTDNVAHDYNIN